MSLAVLTPREASIFACLCDTVVAPAPPFPPVAETDVVTSFDEYLAASPALNRAGLRAALYATELAPRALRMGGRLRSLDSEARGRALEAAAGVKRARPLVQALESIARLSYFGDRGVMRGLGYDASANLARARELRAREARP